jgi:hypothetical protein
LTLPSTCCPSCTVCRSPRVFLNPPFSTHARAWLAKLADHGYGTALTHARTETRWFVETIWTRASAVLFLFGRLHYHHADGTRARANSGAPSVLVAYGDYDAKKLAHCGLAGQFVGLRSKLWPGDARTTTIKEIGPHARP